MQCSTLAKLQQSQPQGGLSQLSARVLVRQRLVRTPKTRYVKRPQYSGKT
jgi:hypothetical protein